MIGANIKQLRLRKGLTQKAFASLCGVSYSTLTKIETGIIKSPRLEHLQNIAQCLEVTVDDLISFKPENE
jgi:transcriptional regulator with XRE-family HTH domain